MNKRLLQRLEHSPVAKGALAVAIFCLIIGGWMGYQRYRNATASLPGAVENERACTLWFVGSSSIHRWTGLQRDMAPWVAHNRGIDDATYAEILPRFANAADDGRPVAIILYAGENDIARAVPVRAVVRQLAEFLDLRSRMLGDVPVLVVSMKPSPGRARNRQAQALFNAAAQRLIPHIREAHYVDITTPMLKDGRTGDNYRADGVHMSPAGYRIWAEVVRRRLRDILPAQTLKRCDPADR